MGDVGIPVPEESGENDDAMEGSNKTTQKAKLGERRLSITDRLFTSKETERKQTTRSENKLSNSQKTNEVKFVALQIENIDNSESKVKKDIALSMDKAVKGDEDDTHSTGSFEEITSQLPDATNSQPVKVSRAWASRENTTVDEKIPSKKNSEEFGGEIPRLEGSDSARLDPSSPSAEEAGWSSRPRCATMGGMSSVQVENDSKVAKNKDTKRPLTARSKGELTQGVRTPQTTKNNTTSVNNARAFSNIVLRPKTPGPNTPRNLGTRDQRSKTMSVIRPKTPVSTAPKAQGFRPKTPKSVVTPQTNRPKTATSRPKTAGHSVSSSQRSAGGSGPKPPESFQKTGENPTKS